MHRPTFDVAIPSRYRSRIAATDIAVHVDFGAPLVVFSFLSTADTAQTTDHQKLAAARRTAFALEIVERLRSECVDTCCSYC